MTGIGSFGTSFASTYSMGRQNKQHKQLMGMLRAGQKPSSTKDPVFDSVDSGSMQEMQSANDAVMDSEAN